MQERLKIVILNPTSETQSVFVARLLIMNNILLAEEKFHSLRTNPTCMAEFMAIKTDMLKAYMIE